MQRAKVSSLLVSVSRPAFLLHLAKISSRFSTSCNSDRLQFWPFLAVFGDIGKREFASPLNVASAVSTAML